MVKFVEEKAGRTERGFNGYMVLGQAFRTKKEALAYGKKSMKMHKSLKGIQYAKVRVDAIGVVKRLHKVS